VLDLTAQYDIKQEETLCSHKAIFLAEQNNKSALHPNPLLNKYDVKFYGLDLFANDTTDDLRGNVEILLQITASSLDTLLVEFSSKLAADSLFINDIKTSFSTTNYTLYTVLDSPALQGSLLRFKLYYHTPENYQSYFFASTRHSNYDDYPVTQTLSEPYFLYEWMPCKQVLTDKADSVNVFVTVDTNLKVAGPGLLTVVPLSNGKHRYEWRTKHKVSYYLIFFAISDYVEEIRYAKPTGTGGDSILILNYRFDHPNNEAGIQNAYDYSKTFLEFFSEHYGMYPFADEKYGHYSWKPPLFSAMEHITMTGMKHYSLGLTSHELGHSWFGNNVTCATWQDIWVNEGFATFSTAFVYGYVFSPSAYHGKMNTYMNSALLAECGSVYVPEDEIGSFGRIFNGRLTYHKGASLVHMLRYMTDNDSLFFLAFRNYQTLYRDSVATGDDFRNVLESTTGIDFFDFFEQWYYGEGYPIYNLVWEQKQDSLWLEVKQTSSCPTTGLFTIPMEYRIRGEGMDTIVKLQQTCNDTTYLLHFSQSIAEIEIDPENWVLNKVDTILQRANFDIEVFLEGAYDSSLNEMSTLLNPDFIPLAHPYSDAPWNCPDSVNLSIIPNPDIVDWLLMEIRSNSYGADSALPKYAQIKKAYLLDKSGKILDLDGSSKPSIVLNTEDSLYLVLRHRNHLPIMSKHALNYQNGTFSYDFHSNANEIYGGDEALSFLEDNVYGMTVSDANANDSISIEDYQEWKTATGTKAYLQSDFDLNTQTDNKDKNDFWIYHINQNAILPEYK
jgi:hypothetical protein